MVRCARAPLSSDTMGSAERGEQTSGCLYDRLDRDRACSDRDNQEHPPKGYASIIQEDGVPEAHDTRQHNHAIDEIKCRYDNNTWNDAADNSTTCP